ncbi:mgtE intracellular N domain protein [Mycobacterium kansasii 732]|nr:mgtE intracellular N domain protein [Mycobacterium kansasii 732]
MDWQYVRGLTPSALAMPGQAVAQLLDQFEGRRPVDVADAIRGLPSKRRYEVFRALDNERLADILQELPESDQAEVLSQLGPIALPMCWRRWIPMTPPTCSGC